MGRFYGIHETMSDLYMYCPTLDCPCHGNESDFDWDAGWTDGFAVVTTKE